MIASIQELLQKEAQAVLNIPVTDAYEKAVELIVEQQLECAFLERHRESTQKQRKHSERNIIH